MGSILNNDLYKFSMQMAVTQLFPRAFVEYQFINRGGTKFPKGFGNALRTEVGNMSDIGLTGNEKRYLSCECKYFTPVYIDLLAGYRFNPREVIINQKGGELSVKVVGPWYRTILWEVPLMSMISELYFKMTKQHKSPDWKDRMVYKTLELEKDGSIKYAGFSTRRRFSFETQDTFVKTAKENSPTSFVGTSNVYFAMKYGVKAIGTQAHEWFMFMGAMYGFTNANRIAMKKWVDVFGGDLGIALSDTYTTDIFFKSFDKKFARLFDGVRQDSGDPYEFADKMIDHYKKMGIDPTTKTIIFSDGLDVETVKKIHVHCNGRVRDSYGIGTNFSNDVGVKPLNMVIKMSKCSLDSEDDYELIPTVKLSDVEGKHTGDKKMIELCKETLGI